MPRVKRGSPAARALVALVAGIVAGLAFARVRGPATQSIVTAIEPIGTLWVNAIRMTVIPLVTSLLIATIASAPDSRALGRLGTRAVVTFLGLLTAFALFTGFVAPTIFSALVVDPASAASLRATVSASPSTVQVPGFAAWLVSIVPSNPVKAAADGSMLPLIIFAVVFALGLARSATELRDPAARFFRALADAMLVVVGWVLAVAPIGVFALSVAITYKLGIDMVGAVGFYIGVHAAMLTVAGVALYVVVAVLTPVRVSAFARALLPAQVVAVSTRSSLAALPAMLDGARVLRLPERIAGFGLSFGVSVFRLNSGVSWTVAALFIGKLYGVPLSGVDIATIAAASVIFSFSVPGIPSGSLFVIAPFFSQLHLPLEAIGILIALDVIPDMFKTLVNVTGHMTATVLLAHGEDRKARAGGLLRGASLALLMCAAHGASAQSDGAAADRLASIERQFPCHPVDFPVWVWGAVPDAERTILDPAKCALTLLAIRQIATGAGVNDGVPRSDTMRVVSSEVSYVRMIDMDHPTVAEGFWSVVLCLSSPAGSVGAEIDRTTGIVRFNTADGVSPRCVQRTPVAMVAAAIRGVSDRTVGTIRIAPVIPPLAGLPSARTPFRSSASAEVVAAVAARLKLDIDNVTERAGCTVVPAARSAASVAIPCRFDDGSSTRTLISINNPTIDHDSASVNLSIFTQKKGDVVRSVLVVVRLRLEMNWVVTTVDVIDFVG